MTESDLDSFQSGYRGSEEERGDVLKYYQQFKGHMAKVRQGGEGWWTAGRGAGRLVWLAGAARAARADKQEGELANGHSRGHVLLACPAAAAKRRSECMLTGSLPLSSSSHRPYPATCRCLSG